MDDEWCVGVVGLWGWKWKLLVDRTEWRENTEDVILWKVMTFLVLSLY